MTTSRDAVLSPCPSPELDLSGTEDTLQTPAAPTFPGSSLSTSNKRAEGPWLLPGRPRLANKANREGSASGKSHLCKSAGMTSKFREIYFRDGFTEHGVLHRLPVVSTPIA